jgi:hypothetical protein
MIQSVGFILLEEEMSKEEKVVTRDPLIVPQKFSGRSRTVG